MARKQTRAELETTIATLQPYAELAAILFGDKACAKRIAMVYGPRKITSGEWAFVLYGVTRAAGGVILDEEGHLLGYACEVCQRWESSQDPYLKDCASQVRRAQKEAVNARYAAE